MPSRLGAPPPTHIFGERHTGQLSLLRGLGLWHSRVRHQTLLTWARRHFLRFSSCGAKVGSTSGPEEGHWLRGLGCGQRCPPGHFLPAAPISPSEAWAAVRGCPEVAGAVQVARDALGEGVAPPKFLGLPKANPWTASGGGGAPSELLRGPSPPFLEGGSGALGASQGSLSCPL